MDKRQRGINEHHNKAIIDLIRRKISPLHPRKVSLPSSSRNINLEVPKTVPILSMSNQNKTFYQLCHLHISMISTRRLLLMERN